MKYGGSSLPVLIFLTSFFVPGLFKFPYGIKFPLGNWVLFCIEGVDHASGLSIAGAELL